MNTRIVRGSHGVYGLLRRVQSGILDGRSTPAAAVRELRAAILADLPGLPTARQEALATEAARKGVILTALYAHALKEPVRDGKLHPLLGEHALAWSNSMRLDLMALGGNVNNEDEDTGPGSRVDPVRRLREMREDEQRAGRGNSE